MALTKVTGQVINTSTDVTVGVLTVTNTLAVGGTVSIGGTLTYEDVTNIDSVGLITARNGIVVGSGITLSKDGDVFATGVTTTGSLVSSGAISGTTGTFSGAVSGTTGTFSGNITANGNIVGDDSTNITGVNQVTIGDLYISENIVHRGDDNTRIRFSDADTIKLETSGIERLQVDSSGNIYVGGVGGSATAGTLWFNDTSANASKIAQSNGNSALTFHTGSSQPERARIDSIGRLLVGTTAGWGSNVKLHLANSTNTYLTITSGTSHNGVLAFSDDGSERAAIDYDHDGDFMVFKTNGNTGERLRIASDGTTTASGTSDGVLQLTTTDSRGAFIRFGQGGSYYNMVGCADGLTSGDKEDLGIRATDNIIFASGGSTERFRIDSVGAITVGERSNIHSSNALARFGIDCHGRNVLSDPTDCSAYGLAFYNDPTTNQANGIGFFNDDGSTCGGYILHQDKGSGNLGDIVFGTSASSNNPEERIRITQHGNFLAGRTNTITVDSQGTNHVFEQLGSSDFALGIHCDQSTQRGIGVYYTGSKTASDFMFCQVAGSIKFELKGNGGLANVQSNDVNLSDISVKKNITDAQSTINEVKQWKIKEFHLTDDEDSAVKRFGVVAQDMETIDPKLVTEYGSNLKGVKEQQIYWKAIKSLQEAIVKIETLEAEVAALKSN